MSGRDWQLLLLAWVLAIGLLLGTAAMVWPLLFAPAVEWILWLQLFGIVWGLLVWFLAR